MGHVISVKFFTKHKFSNYVRHSESESPRHIVARCIRTTLVEPLYLARSDDIYLEGDYARYARGVAGNTYYHENICKSLPRDVDVGYSLPSVHCFGRLFSTYNRAVPSYGPLRHSHSPAARHRIGIYGTYGGRYVLWLIVLLSLTYFQFTAAARRFASWLSIVRDERRFMCHPGLYLGLRPARVFIRERLIVSNTISGISS